MIIIHTKYITKYYKFEVPYISFQQKELLSSKINQTHAYRLWKDANRGNKDLNTFTKVDFTEADFRTRLKVIIVLFIKDSWR